MHGLTLIHVSEKEPQIYHNKISWYVIKTQVPEMICMVLLHNKTLQTEVHIPPVIFSLNI